MLKAGTVSRAAAVVGFVMVSSILAGGGTAIAQSPVTPPGTGTLADPYLISELGHLVWMSDNTASSSGKYYSMTADIDASATATWNDDGTSTDVLEGFRPIWNPSWLFGGVFDGNGHTIGRLVINRPGTDYVGLFGRVAAGAQVRNLGVLGGSVSGKGYVGGLVGYNLGTVSSCYVTSTVAGADRYVGNLVGQNDGTVKNCCAVGMVTGSGDVLGGLVGLNRGPVSSCYFAGVVTTPPIAGGLVAGKTSSGLVSNSYWDLQSSGRATSAGGTGKSTAEMKQQSTFEGWDFTNAWAIDEGNSYPYLRFFPSPFKVAVDVAGPGTVTLDPGSADGTYAPGTVVTLTAVSSGPEYGIVRWMGAAPAGSATATVVMDAHRSVTVVFGPRIEINSLSDLTKIGTDPAFPLQSVLYVLTTDIDASETAIWNDAGTGTDALEGFMPIGSYGSPFAGSFDGSGHTVTGLTVNRSNTDYIGLFGCTGLTGWVRNLNIVGSMVKGKQCVGTLVGYGTGTLSSCYAIGRTYGSSGSTGGLVGCNTGTVSDCHAAGTTSGFSSTGGLVGGNRGVLSRCYATCAVTGDRQVGGLLGSHSSGIVSNCFATGAVAGAEDAGGLVGLSYDGLVLNCYATGPVAGSSDVGGLVGVSYGTVTSSYWDVATSGISASAGGTGLNTGEMKQQATFTDWDFTEAWSIAEGTSYPYLHSLSPPFRLTVDTSGLGSVTADPPSADGTYPPGTVVTLTATPDGAGNAFLGWMGAAPADSPTATIVMDIHRSATAVFGQRIEINSLADLARIGNDPACPLSNALYVLTADIDASETATWNDVGTGTDTLEGFRPIGDDSHGVRSHFTGIFDGAGHTITGMVVNRSATNYVGLFGYIGSGGQVKNLRIVGGVVSGMQYVGGLVGANVGGSLSHCYAANTVMGSYSDVGGLAGANYVNRVSYCCASGAVTAAQYAGGLIGTNTGKVSNCFATGSVKGPGYYFGGLVAYNHFGAVSNCYSTGATTGSQYVGGLIGDNGYYGEVSNCYAAGAVSGTVAVGGLVGASDPLQSWVSDSYWDMQASGQSTSAGGTGKTTADMRQQTTFAGWDFANTWAIAEGVSYPYAQAFPSPFELVISVSGPGAVTISPASVGSTYAPGTEVSLTAVPSRPGDVFIGWEGAVPSDSPTSSVIMDIHRSVTAVFLPRIEISTLADLAKIGNDPQYPLRDALYVLTADIDASETATWNDVGTDTTVLEGFKPIGTNGSPFTGVFDGNGHALSNLMINQYGYYYVGLFGCIGPGGCVRNLSLTGSTVSGVEHVGGMVGRLYYGVVSNCRATGAAIGDHSIGGLVGSCSYGMLSDCFAASTITAFGPAGGLVGSGSYSAISDCFATGAVTGEQQTGGLVGKSQLDAISDCYATGPVKGLSIVGGLVGYRYYGTVSRCYSTGAVKSDLSDSGGLIGLNYADAGVVSDSYWDVQTSGQSTSAGGTGKTTLQMKQKATFVGWDFASVWAIREGVTYPLLRSLSDADRDGVPDPVDICPGTVPGATVNILGCPPLVSGDFNRDGDVDPADVSTFEACVSGPAVLFATGCSASDIDDDDDVDQSDFGILQRCFSGENMPADPACDN